MRLDHLLSKELTIIGCPCLCPSVVQAGCSWVEYQWTQYWKACTLVSSQCGWCVRVRGTGCGCRVFAHLRVRVRGSLASWVLESGVRVLCGLYGLACCWVLRQQASVPVGWVLVGFSALCGGFGWCVACGWRGSWCFGVCPVFAAGALVWWRFCAVARVCLRGCGVVVWELYSEREHLADEMSLGVLFLGSLGV